MKTVSRPVSGLLLLLLTVLLLMGWGTFEVARAFITEDRARAQATLTSRILLDLTNALEGLLEMETAKRGYIITRDDVYLERYPESTALFNSAIKDLQQRLDGIATQTQSQLIDSLETLGTEKIAEIEETLGLARGGQYDAASAMIATGEGKALMDRIRVVTGQLEAYELSILNSALERAERIQARSSWLLLFLGIGVACLFALLLLQVRRITKLNVVEANLEMVEHERAKTEILARELNHRVKNLFAIVLSIIRQTGLAETDASVVSEKVYHRVHALARAHELTAQIDGASATTLRQLLTSVVSPFVEREDALSLDGPGVDIHTEQVTPLGLILNELATNATKYGAWATDTGRIEIAWRKLDTDASDANVELHWNEIGADPPAAKDDVTEGFGSKLVDVSIRQLQGTCKTEWNPDGLSIVMTLNLGE